MHKKNIEASLKPVIKIKTQVQSLPKLYRKGFRWLSGFQTKTSSTPVLDAWQSKFGGNPYFPKNCDYPLDKKRQPMVLLAQINFNETPKLENFPEQGLLQVYLSAGSESFGLCYADQLKQDDFRIVYFPQIDEDPQKLITNFDFLPKTEYMPIEKESALSFSLEYEPISVFDFQFEEKILNQGRQEKDTVYQQNMDFIEAYEQHFPAYGHKIGGYPYFTQSDPRNSAKFKDQGFILLFQIDSDDPAGVLWGDAGVANFFIRERDLKEKNFSEVLYNWDCC